LHSSNELPATVTFPWLMLHRATSIELTVRFKKLTTIKRKISAKNIVQGTGRGDEEVVETPWNGL
jgi:hypothetical protein